MDSRQVNGWYETYLYAERVAASHGVALDHRLIPGTARWCGMPDTDARKLLALILGGVREALAHDTRQEAMSEASKAVAASANWSQVGRDRGDAYIPREEVA